MPSVPVLDHAAVLAAVSPAAAIEAVREAFVHHRRGEWVMPSKVYLDSPGFGDFRAMPARGDGLAMLKWISSFPENPARGLPTVIGIVLLNDAETSEPVLVLDAGAVTALRTGAVAAVASRALAPAAQTAAVIGCGVNGAATARSLLAAGYVDGILADPRPDAAQLLADELGHGWRAGTLQEALAQDTVSCVTPGGTPLVTATDLRPGLHLNMLGADGPGKAEASVNAVAGCRLFCDEWAQASHGGELTGAVEAGRVAREDVTDLGAVLLGEAPPPDATQATLFDSTGLAIQDLSIARAALHALRAGAVTAGTMAL